MIARHTKKKLTLDDVRKQFKVMTDSDQLWMCKIFDDATVEQIYRELSPQDSEHRKRIFTIPVTLWLFVQQVLSKDRGCKEVVGLLNKKRKAENRSEVSTNTTSYCQARMRIPLTLIEKLMYATADLAFGSLPTDWRWSDHRVLLLDGLVVHGTRYQVNQIRNGNDVVKLPYSGNARAGIDSVFFGIQSGARGDVRSSTNKKLEATRFEL